MLGSVHLQCARDGAGMHCREGPMAGCGDLISLEVNCYVWSYHIYHVSMQTEQNREMLLKHQTCGEAYPQWDHLKGDMYMAIWVYQVPNSTEFVFVQQIAKQASLTVENHNWFIVLEQRERACWGRKVVNQLWFSTVLLACCKTSAICCTHAESKAKL